MAAKKSKNIIAMGIGTLLVFSLVIRFATPLAVVFAICVTLGAFNKWR